MPRLLVLIFCLIAPIAHAEGRAGTFDYYLLSLSWSPNWCAGEGAGRGSPQCAGDYGFVLHGLWPQYERGWPDDCRSSFAPPSRAMTNGMTDIMGDAGSAWHQWNKHGVCSGLSPDAYYALARQAYGRVAIPEIFTVLSREISLPAELVERAFLRDNPGLEVDQITITCQSGAIQEVRLCLTRDLDFRRCGADAIRDCTLEDAVMAPIE